MSEFQKILDCEHDFGAIGEIYDCEKCGASERDLAWVQVVVKFEVQRDQLLAALEFYADMGN